MESISRVWLSWQLLSAAGPFLDGLVFSSLLCVKVEQLQLQLFCHGTGL